MATETPQNISRIERVLAFMLLALVLLSVGSFIAVMVGTGQGMGSNDFADGLWPMVVMIPYIGLPVAFLMLLALIIIGAVKRSRAAKNELRS